MVDSYEANVVGVVLVGRIDGGTAEGNQNFLAYLKVAEVDENHGKGNQE